jgi:hypothetical protein
MGLYNKTLRIRNVRQIDRFCKKLVPFIVKHKHINFDKHTSLLQNLHISNLQCFKYRPQSTPLQYTNIISFTYKNWTRLKYISMYKTL